MNDNIKLSNILLLYSEPKDEQEKERTPMRLVARSCLSHALWGPAHHIRERPFCPEAAF